MFQTLKAHSRAMGDSEFVVQSSIAAADIVKTKKQPACTRCRGRKLKCVIQEGSSCERCLERGLRCSYDDVTVGGGSNSRRSASRMTSPEEKRDSASRHKASKKSISSTTDDHIISPSSLDMIEVARSDHASDSSHHSASSRTTTTATTEGTISSEDDYSVYMDTSKISPIDFDVWTPSLIPDLHSEFFTTGSTAEDAMEIEALAAACSPTALQANVGGDGGGRSCSCSELLMSANATMQVKMMWTTSPDSHGHCHHARIDNMLQCQTKVLNSCEALVACSRCCYKSDLVVLVISMCRDMVQATKLAVQAMDAVQAQAQDQSGGSPGGRRLLGLGASTGGALVGGGNGVTGGGDNSRLDTMGWQLEDDEEHEMVRTLINIRVTKLKKLMGQLEQIVRANHAPYSWIINTLLQSLMDCK